MVLNSVLLHFLVAPYMISKYFICHSYLFIKQNIHISRSFLYTFTNYCRECRGKHCHPFKHVTWLVWMYTTRDFFSNCLCRYSINNMPIFLKGKEWARTVPCRFTWPKIKTNVNVLSWNHLPCQSDEVSIYKICTKHVSKHKTFSYLI